MSFGVQSPAAATAAAGGDDPIIYWPDRAQARFQLEVLDTERSGIELRAFRGGQMQKQFFPTAKAASERAVSLGATADVYVGVLPRAGRAGGREALLPEGRMIWAECDTQMAVVRALEFTPAPSMLVSSSYGKAHAYWLLRNPLPLDLIERANKRIAWHLGGDLRSCDPARILRVAGTRNHKYERPSRVAINHLCYYGELPRAADFIANLPDPSAVKIPVRAPRPTFGPDAERDQLAAVPARLYVSGLADRDVLHNMVQCPFHGGGQERTPSLHVGGPNDTLWHCFGCDEGGDIFSFAAKLWGMDETRDFRALKDRLKGARL